MVTVISRFRVRNRLEEQVRQAFLARPRLVDSEAGFCGLEVLTDAADASTFLLITRWTSEAAFRAWHRSEAHHHSHGGIPEGLKLDASFTQIVVGNRIEDPQGASNLSDALEGQTAGLSRWLLDADAVFALLLGPDGTIRFRNRAAERIFPGNTAGLRIWDFLVCPDAPSLELRQSDPSARSNRPILLNLIDGQNDPVTAEISVIDCAGGFLLLGAIEQRQAWRLQTELEILTNQLSTMTRDLAHKNKELEAANRAIEQIARIDALTGLVNRRTLDEALSREVARAGRQRQPLTLVIGDIDHFKRINDTYGHVVGDQVLSDVGKVLGSDVRPYDLAARFGGEEFVLLFPGTGVEEGVVAAERVRRKIESLQVRNCPERITISLGAATWMDSESAEAFVARCDTALYRAKNGGRNRVEADRAGGLHG